MSTFSATATRQDGSTIPLALYDDSTHTDKYPGDAFYSMQFTAAASEPLYIVGAAIDTIDILVQAAYGNLVHY